MPEVALPPRLFALNPGLDIGAATARFAATGRAQLREVLLPEAAAAIHAVLASATPWGMALEAGTGPEDLRADKLATLPAAERTRIGQAVGQRLRGGEYGFVYQRYPMVTAYLERWDPDGPLAMLLEHINDTPMLALVRAVSGIDAIFKADAQATLFGPGQFLGVHDDADGGGTDGPGRRVAYVLNFAPGWHPDWGGYLNFLDADNNVIEGFAPRFNTLNLFRVPQRHHVTYVPQWALPQRFAITGWFRDR